MYISKHIRPILAFAAITLGIISTPAVASDEYYRWIGDDGVTHYGSRPPEGVEAEKISTYGSKKGAAKSSTYSTYDDDKNAKSGPSTEEQKKALAMRKEQCQQEQARLSKLQSPGTRIRMQNDDGTSRYLTPEEISSEVSSSKKFIGEACK